MEEARNVDTEAAERVRQVAGDARRLWGELEEVGAAVARLTRDRLEAAPYRTLGGVALVGYLLGGGLASPLTRQLVRLGARLLFLPLLRDVSGFTENLPNEIFETKH